MPGPIVISADAFVSTWTVQPERRAEFITLFNALWQGEAAQMAEVTNFVFYGWGRNPNEFVAIESWKSNDIVTAVRASDGFKTAVAALLDCCSKPMTMNLFSPWEGGDRSVFKHYPAGPSTVHPKGAEVGAVFL
jgi:quinol monooxygenase YgiN